MAEDVSSKKKLFVSDTIWYVTGIADYINTCGIYTGYLTVALMEIFKSTLQYIFFPIYAVHSLIYTALAAVNMHLDRKKKTGNIKGENLIRLIINSVSSLLILAAVIGTCVSSAAIGIAGTALFALNLGITGVYNFVGGFYHLYKYVQHGRHLNDPTLTPADREHLQEKRKVHIGKMIGYFVVGITTAMIALAGALAILGGWLPLAAIGIAAGVIGMSFSAYAMYKHVQKGDSDKAPAGDDKQADMDDKKEAKDTLGIQRQLSGSSLRQDISRVEKDEKITEKTPLLPAEGSTCKVEDQIRQADAPTSALPERRLG